MRLHFQQLGHGEPLVVLHGLFGCGENWLGIAARLAEKFRVYLLDLRNHGQSPHAAQIDYPLMAADVREFFAAQNLEAAMFLGHSMGGKVAMRLALDEPSLVKKLVVADVAPRAYARAHDPIFAALLALDPTAFERRNQIEEALAQQIPSLAIRRFLLKNLGRDEGGRFFWKMNVRSLHENYDRLCQAVSGQRPFEGPALFVRGGASAYITPADETDIRRQFPAARIATISSAGHWIHADAPDEFMRLVLAFLLPDYP
jgi:pimeloyl-ACP methyl ester carboxylesterase